MAKTDNAADFTAQYSDDGFWGKVRGYAKTAGRGVLEPASDGKASSLVRLPGLGPQRCYIVKRIPGTDESEARAA